jgi:hypothetical protein
MDRRRFHGPPRAAASADRAVCAVFIMPMVAVRGGVTVPCTPRNTGMYTGTGPATSTTGRGSRRDMARDAQVGAVTGYPGGPPAAAADAGTSCHQAARLTTRR